jgi:hypothetical protein
LSVLDELRFKHIHQTVFETDDDCHSIKSCRKLKRKENESETLLTSDKEGSTSETTPGGEFIVTQLKTRENWRFPLIKVLLLIGLLPLCAGDVLANFGFVYEDS